MNAFYSLSSLNQIYILYLPLPGGFGSQAQTARLLSVLVPSGGFRGEFTKKLKLFQS